MNRYLSLLVFVALALPEAHDNSRTLGLFYLRQIPLAPADLAAGVLFVAAVLHVIVTRKIRRSRFTAPLVLLTAVVALQGLRSVATYPTKDIIADSALLLELWVAWSLRQLGSLDRVGVAQVTRALVAGPVAALWIGLLMAALGSRPTTDWRIAYRSYDVAVVSLIYYILSYRAEGSIGNLVRVLLSAVAVVAALLVSGSRGALLMMLMGVGSATLVAAWLREGHGAKRLLGIVAIAPCIGVLGLVLAMYVAPQSVELTRLRLSTELTVPRLRTDVRTTIWANEFLRLAENPLLILAGGGLGSRFALSMDGAEVYFQFPAESAFMFWLDKAGVIGLFSFLSYLALFLLCAWQVMKRSRSRRTWNSEAILGATVLAWSPLLVVQGVGPGLWKYRSLVLFIGVSAYLLEQMLRSPRMMRQERYGPSMGALSRKSGKWWKVAVPRNLCSITAEGR